MGYMHIDNLYKNQEILMFKECYAMEKIHGTSVHISWEPETKEIKYFSGGVKHETFIKLFDQNALLALFTDELTKPTVFFGEAYGGKMQRMSHTYGKELKFIVFDVKIGNTWLSVPHADGLARSCDFEFVDYALISTDLETIDAYRDKPSIQAKRNGILEDKVREGIVLRPLIEVRKNNGARIIAKHKTVGFRERRSIIKLQEYKNEDMQNAQEIAKEWVVPMRLNHVLDKIGNPCELSAIPIVVKAMIEDVCREAEGLIADNKYVRKEIGKETVRLYKALVTREQLDNDKS